MHALGNVLGLLALGVNLVVVFKRPRTGIALYVALAMVLPNAVVAGVTVAFEIYALPAVVGLALAKRPRLLYPRLHMALGLFLSLLVFSTIVGTTTHGSELDPVRFQGLVRFLVLLALVAEFLDRVTIEKVLVAVLGTNAAAGLVQMLVPGTAGLFFGLYGRAGQAALERYALEDLIPRATGTFNSPVILGSVALLGVAVAWAGLISTRSQRHHRWLLFLSALAGILSLSKTFILGTPLILGAGLLLAPFTSGTRAFRMRPRTAALTVAAMIVALGAIGFMARYLQQAGFGVEYYMRFLLDPQEAFATRYGPGGHLEETIGVIRANPIFGVGVTKVRGEFLGDSTYILLLHATGFLGVFLAGTGLAVLTHRIMAAGRQPELLVVAALLMAGTALPIVFSLPGALGIVHALRLDRHPASARKRRERALARPVASSHVG